MTQVYAQFDVVKTRRQVKGHVDKESVLKTMMKIAQAEGYQGVFRGAAPRLAKVVPACAIMMSSFVSFWRFYVHFDVPVLTPSYG